MAIPQAPSAPGEYLLVLRRYPLGTHRPLSRRGRCLAGVAQSAERFTRNEQVRGSIPRSGSATDASPRAREPTPTLQVGTRRPAIVETGTIKDRSDHSEAARRSIVPGPQKR